MPLRNSENEVTGRPSGGLEISSNSGPPLASFKQLSKLDRIHAVQPQYCIDINGAST